MLQGEVPWLRLIPRQLHRCLAGHPWVFRSEIPGDLGLADGAVVDVHDAEGVFVGRGLYGRQSQIAVRLLSDRQDPIDAAFFRARLRAAIAYRRQIAAGRAACRLVSSEGDHLPGLIVDCYGDAVVVQTTTAAMDVRLDLWCELMREELRPGLLVERNDLAVRRLEGLPLRSGVRFAADPARAATTSVPVRVQIGRIAYDVDLLDPHKTGAYLDQQSNHEAVAALLAQVGPGARVLDACCHIGGFALHLLQAGAASALGIDTSAPALAIASAAAAQAGFAGRFVAERGDAFNLLRARADAVLDEQERFDVIVLDPPSFAKRRADAEAALRGYRELHRQALRLLRRGGVLTTFSCSHHIGRSALQACLAEAAGAARRPLRRIAEFGAAPDHPVRIGMPESEYLVGLAVQALDRAI